MRYLPGPTILVNVNIGQSHFFWGKNSVPEPLPCPKIEKNGHCSWGIWILGPLGWEGRPQFLINHPFDKPKGCPTELVILSHFCSKGDWFFSCLLNDRTWRRCRIKHTKARRLQLRAFGFFETIDLHSPHHTAGRTDFCHQKKRKHVFQVANFQVATWAYNTADKRILTNPTIEARPDVQVTQIPYGQTVAD